MSLYSLCCLMNRKVNSFKQCFYWNNRMFCGTKRYKCPKCSVSVLTHACSAIVLPLVYCPVECRQLVVWSQPRNLQFRCVKSLLLSWKPSTFWSLLSWSKSGHFGRRTDRRTDRPTFVAPKKHYPSAGSKRWRLKISYLKASNALLARYRRD